VKTKRKPDLVSTRIPTDLGEFAAAFSKDGLAELNFPDRSDKLDPFAGDPPKKLLQQTTRALCSILSGKHPRKFPKLDFSIGTKFQQSVWEAMLRIPLGETKSYADIAREIGNPKGVRAVGVACGANPIPVIVPCHRVLGTNWMGGFSAGMTWKHRLLELEGILTPSLFD